MVWEYACPRAKYDGDGNLVEPAFFSTFVSGMQRLPNGNTLVCSGQNARVFELTPDKEIVWEYKSPYGGGDTGMGFLGFDTLYRAERVPYSWTPLGVPEVRELTVSSNSGGSVTTPGEGTFEYDYGAVAQIEATPDEHRYFRTWMGSAVDAGKVADPDKASTTVTVDGEYDLMATFLAKDYTITVSSTEGGSVTEPGEGEFSISYNYLISLVATPDEHYHFVGWSGSAAGNVGASASTGVLVDRDCDVMAHFAIDTHTLTLTTSSTDGGSVTTPGEETKEYDYGTTVDLVATPEIGYCFVGSTGPLADPSSESTTVTITEDTSVEAVFESEKKPKKSKPSLNPRRSPRDRHPRSDL
jgi:hypothetical protein